MRKIIAIFIIAVLIGIIPRSKQTAVNATPTVRYLRTGKASWYSHKSPGIHQYTANMELFNDSALTCAMWGVSFGRNVKVTNLANGKSIIVRVNDRGPHERFVRKGRIIDLTRAAFLKISDSRNGLIDVQLEFL